MNPPQPSTARRSVSSSNPWPSAASAMIPQTHGGWIPPHDPSASCRSRIHCSATAYALRRSGPGRRGGRVFPGMAPMSRRSTSGVPHRPQRLRHRQRHEGLPRPAREVVDRERGRRRQQHQLRRDRHHPLPRPLAEQREEALREQAALRDAALAPDVLARARTGIDAAHPQCDVRLDRGGEVGRAFEPDRPRSVLAHTGRQLVRDAAVERRRAQPEEVVPEEMLRGHGHVRLELADPDAVRPLQLEQPSRAAVDRLVEARQVGGGDRHAATVVVESDNTSAAAA